MLQKRHVAALVDDRFDRLDHQLDPRPENQRWNPLTCTVKVELTPTDIASPVEQATSKRFSMQLRPEAHTVRGRIEQAFLARAPAHVRQRHVGRVRPRRSGSGPRMRDAGGVAHAPYLLRHPCWGAHRAAQCAARSQGTVGDNIAASKQSQACDCGDGDWAVAVTRRRVLCIEGPTAP